MRNMIIYIYIYIYIYLYIYIYISTYNSQIQLGKPLSRAAWSWSSWTTRNAGRRIRRRAEPTRVYELSWAPLGFWNFSDGWCMMMLRCCDARRHFWDLDLGDYPKKCRLFQVDESLHLFSGLYFPGENNWCKQRFDRYFWSWVDFTLNKMEIHHPKGPKGGLRWPKVEWASLNWSWPVGWHGQESIN